MVGNTESIGIAHALVHACARSLAPVVCTVNLHRICTVVPPSPVRWPRRSPARSSDRNGRRASQTASERCPVSVAQAPVKSPRAGAPCAIGTCSDSSVKSDSAAGRNDPCAGNQVSSFTPRAHTPVRDAHLCARRAALEISMRLSLFMLHYYVAACSITLICFIDNCDDCINIYNAIITCKMDRHITINTLKLIVGMEYSLLI